MLHPFGEDAKGRLVYTDDGTFCAQLVHAHRAPSADPNQCSPAETERYFKGCISYFGAYELYSRAGLVIHHVEGALHPNWEGHSFKRYYALSDGLLTLKTPYIAWDGEHRLVGTIVWRRLRHPGGEPATP